VASNLHSEKVRASREEPRQSAPAHDRILRAARTIADLDGGGPIRLAHVVEAICYRSLDRRRLCAEIGYYRPLS
jgi:magnesium chelatase family protein